MATTFLLSSLLILSLACLCASENFFFMKKDLSFLKNFRNETNILNLPGQGSLVILDSSASEKILLKLSGIPKLEKINFAQDSLPYVLKIEVPETNIDFLIALNEIDSKVQRIVVRKGNYVFADVSRNDGVYALESLSFPVSKSFLEFQTPVETINFAAGSVSADLKKQIVDSISADKYIEQIEILSGVKPFTIDGVSHTTRTRNTYSDQIKYDTQYIAQYFKKLGLEVEIQPFEIGKNSAENVVGIKRGVDSAEIVVIGGHYDSTSEIPKVTAPGAVDDGSGTAGVLEAARVLANYSTSKTIHFVTFSGEEQGIYGSKFYVKNAVARSDKIISALIMDMICYSKKYYGVIIEGKPSYQSLMTLMEQNVKLFAPDLEIKQTLQSFGSDHVSFQNAGIPAFLAIERDDTDYPSYHKSTDEVTNCNRGLGSGIVKGITGTLIDLAVPLPKQK